MSHVQRQKFLLVGEQDGGLEGGLQGQTAVRRASNNRWRGVGSGHQIRGIEFTKSEPNGEEMLQSGVQVVFRDELLLECGLQLGVCLAAVEVAASLEGKRGGFGHVLGETMVEEEVAERTAVGGHIALEAPLVAQELLEVFRGGATAFAVGAVVGTHHADDMRGLDQVAEGGQVGRLGVVWRDLRVESMTLGFGTAMSPEVLGAGRREQVLRMVALESANEGLAHLRGQEGIFAVGLLPASPAWVAEDVDVGGPVGESEVLPTGRTASACVVVFGTALVCDGACDSAHQGGIEGRGKADGLRKYGCSACPRHAMQSLVPPVAGGDAQARDGGSGEGQLGAFLLPCQLPEQQSDAFVEGTA